MQSASLAEIRSEAIELHENNSPWHFHVMSPECMLNTNDKYAFVLESPSDGLIMVHLSDKAEKDLASELSPLLHGSDVMDSKATAEGYSPSEIVLQMKERALDLNEKNVQWHHHMLYPDCVFNGYSPNHVLMIEDSSTGEAILSITEEDPKDDLKQIENLYFVNE